MTTFSSEKGATMTRAFTLVEMMVTVTLLGLVLVAIIPTFSVFTKSVAGLGNYASMSRDSRSGLEVLSRDLHAAQTLTRATKDEVVLTLPTDAGGDRVSYKYMPNVSDPSAGKVTRTITPPGGSATTTDFLSNVGQFNLVYYNKLGVDVTNSASILNEAKSIQINAKLVKEVITTDTTDYIISARFLMRNK